MNARRQKSSAALVPKVRNPAIFKAFALLITWVATSAGYSLPNEVAIAIVVTIVFVIDVVIGWWSPRAR